MHNLAGFRLRKWYLDAVSVGPANETWSGAALRAAGPMTLIPGG
jgi:hypothetical protein